MLIIALWALLLSDHAAGWDVSGTVLDPEGKPASQVTLWMSQNRITKKISGSSDGTFAFQGLNPGPITIVAYKEGFGLGGVEGQLLDDESITLHLTRPAALSLNIMDIQSDPITGARLKWLQVDEYLTIYMEDIVRLGFPSVRSDSDGLMTIPFLPTNSYAGVTVSHSRHAESHLPTIPVGLTIPMVMVEGKKLRGRVTNPEGEGVSRARVTVFRSGDEREYKFSEVLTDLEGFYSTTVPPAPYFVAVKHPDYGLPKPQPAIISPDTKNLIVDISMPEGFWITGTTVDRNKEPVKFAKIAYTVEGVIYDEAVSDSTGHFSVWGNTGEAVLHITPPKGMITQAYPAIPVRVDNAALDISPITLMPLPSIMGTVTTRDGSPVANAIIHTQNTQPILWTRSGDDGTFQIQLTKMQEDPVQLVAEHPTRFLRRDASVDLLKPKPLDIKLRSFKPDTSQQKESIRNDLTHMVDKDAPDWACDAWLNLPEGMNDASLSDLAGRVVVLTLWGGFDADGPTRERIRELNELHAVFENTDDVFFLAIHDASLEPVEVQEFIRNWNITMPVGCDADPFLSFDIYNVNLIPQTVLIDKKGVLRYYNVDGRLHELIKAMRRD